MRTQLPGPARTCTWLLLMAAQTAVGVVAGRLALDRAEGVVVVARHPRAVDVSFADYGYCFAGIAVSLCLMVVAVRLVPRRLCPLPAALVAAPFFWVESADEARADAAGHIYDLSLGPWPPTVVLFLFALAVALVAVVPPRRRLSARRAG